MRKSFLKTVSWSSEIQKNLLDFAGVLHGKTVSGNEAMASDFKPVALLFRAG